MKRLTLAFLILFLGFVIISYTSKEAVAAGALYETTFDCAEWDASGGPGTINCDGLLSAVDCSCSGGEYEQITTDANYPGGGGVRGKRHWRGSGKNNNSCSPNFVISPGRSEVWIRWYQRYEEGFSWGGNAPTGLKIVYFTSSGNPVNVIFGMAWGRMRLLIGGSKSYYSPYDNDWTNIMSGPDGKGDGKWRSYEIHMDAETGVFSLWIDGEYYFGHTDVNYGGAVFNRFSLPVNGDGPNHTGCMYEDVDDVLIVGPEYSNFVKDAQGRDMIGPIGESQTSPVDPEPPEGILPGAQEILLLEDWEDNNINNWDDDYIQGDTYIDTAPVYQGNYAIKMVSTNPGNYAHFFGDHPGVDGEMVTDVTVEEYYYPGTGLQWPSIGLKLWVMNSFEAWNAGYSSAEGQGKPHTWAPYYMTIRVDNKGEFFGQLSRSDGLGGGGELWGAYPQNQGAPVTLVPGTWNKIKFRLKLNTLGISDGIFKLWINDVLKCDYSNMNYRGTYSSYGWNHLMMSMQGNPSHPQAQWIKRDNIIISTGEGSVISAPESFRRVQ